MRGFTLLEASLSTALFGAVLTVGAVVTRDVSTTVASTASAGEEDTRDQRRSLHVERRIRSASRGSLDGVPAGCSDPEPMLEYVGYQEVWFQSAVGYSSGEVVLEPAVGENKFRMVFDVDWDSEQPGRLLFDDGRQLYEWIDNVHWAQFYRDDRRIVVQIVRYDDDGYAYYSEQSFVLMTP